MRITIHTKTPSLSHFIWKTKNNASKYIRKKTPEKLGNLGK
jgi:hypothetical protein